MLVSFRSFCFRQGGTSRPFSKFDIYPLRINFDQSFGHVAFCRLVTGYRCFKRVECFPLCGKTVEAGNYWPFGTASYSGSLESSATPASELQISLCEQLHSHSSHLLLWFNVLLNSCPVSVLIWPPLVCISFSLEDTFFSDVYSFAWQFVHTSFLRLFNWYYSFSTALPLKMKFTSKSHYIWQTVGRSVSQSVGRPASWDS